MPCDQVRTVYIDLGKVDPDRLAGVLRADGWQVSVQRQDLGLVRSIRALRGTVDLQISADGKVAVRGYADVDKLTSDIKRGLAASVVRDMATRFGWKVKSEAENGGVVKMRLGK